MIEVRLNEREVNIKGHAGAGPIGQDLVCCAVSTLFYSLVANIEHYTCNIKYLSESGDATIKTYDDTETLNSCFRYFEIAIRELQEAYPDKIKII